MNTVALLYLCEVDNGAYTFLLGERVRREVEMHGRVQITDHEAADINASKILHGVLLVVAQLGAVFGVGLSIWSAIVMVPVMSGFMAVWLAAMVDGVRRGTDASANSGKAEQEQVGKAVALNLAKATGQSFCGLVVFGVLAIFFVPW